MNLKYLLFSPLRVAKKIISYFIIEINEYKYPLSKRYNTLINSYRDCKFDKRREVYIGYLNKILHQLDFEKYSELEGMYSEHLIIFAAISYHHKNIKKILEIGTHNGKTACILSNLFPSAQITTIDLNDNDPIFRNSYKRSKVFEEFIKNRNNLLNKYKNINFIKMNSLELSIAHKKLPLQDLIWVDGAHGYPVVSSDITNSIGLMHEKTFLICDDIWKKVKVNDSLYESNAGFETLSAFAEAKIIKNHLFRKRINKIFNGNYKYVSLSKLKSKPNLN